MLLSRSPKGKRGYRPCPLNIRPWALGGVGLEAVSSGCVRTVQGSSLGEGADVFV